MASGEVNQRRVREPTAFITNLATKHSNARLLPIGSILMALAGQGRTKGMVAILEIEASCNQSLAAFVCDERYLPLLCQVGPLVCGPIAICDRM